MTDQLLTPQSREPIDWADQSFGKNSPDNPEREVTQDTPGFFKTLDKPLMLIVSVLIAISIMMVYSTTFDWSYQSRGSATAILLEDHVRNIVIGLVAMVFITWIDYRIWKRFSIWLLIITIGALIAVILFGEETFGARRSLIGGRFQPGELAEFAIIVYMAAWLGSRNTRVQSFMFGMIPFGVVTLLVAGLVALQPDFSSAGVIVLTAGTMFFLAGARLSHLFTVIAIVGIAGLFFIQNQSYARQRIDDYNAALEDPTQANYHTQQAIIAFLNGGWTGVGLGQGQQKFGFLPAPHTDSIFAVIGEELGIVGAAAVVGLFIAFAVRGFQIARNAFDSYGALLAVGFTAWIMIRALLNVAVMTGRVPSSGIPLPFISYGGSALLVVMVSAGLLFSIHRVSVIQQHSLSRRKKKRAYYDRGWGNRRARLSRTRYRRGDTATEFGDE